VIETDGAVEFTRESRLPAGPFALPAESLHGLRAADHRFVTTS
jgi:hypothetical protein